MHVKPPEPLLLAHQQFGYEIGAQREKQVHSEPADVGYHVSVAHLVRDVTYEDSEEGEKTEAVQFRNVKARRFQLRLRSF
jgi:hypothetical protein